MLYSPSYFSVRDNILRLLKKKREPSGNNMPLALFIL
nr:MAG TPA: hypothetical protein [Caudoviricetes sp.]